MWVIVLEHLYRCYVEYRLNTRVSIWRVEEGEVETDLW